MEIKNKVFVVTGAGSGIGKAIALELVKRGAFVAACARTSTGIEDTLTQAGALAKNMKTYLFDVASLEEVNALPNKILADFKRVDGLINNAGIAQKFATAENIPFEEIKRVFDVNFFGMVNMTRAFLPHLKDRQEKTCIVNLSSMAGFIPFPRQSIYAASKGAVKMFSEALYAELKGTNVSVSVIFPGAVVTPLTENAEKQLNTKGKKPYKMLTSEKCALLVAKAIKREKFYLVAGTDAKLLNLLYKISPKMAIDILLLNMKGIFKEE